MPPWHPHGRRACRPARGGAARAVRRASAERRRVAGGRGVADADTLHILARLLGGGKKRKKKTYTKPKKQKHKHKKIKMRVLKFFKARRPQRALPPCHTFPLVSQDVAAWKGSKVQRG